MIKYGLLHCHTENSIDDSTLSTDELCRVAKEKGAPVVAISDHGTMMGCDDFLTSAKKYDIKPILGVEAYYKDPDTNMNSHLILYAKNKAGYIQMCKAMSRGIYLNDGRCCLTDDSLEYLRGGNVIATSACIQGVLGSAFIYNYRKDEAVRKLNPLLLAAEQAQQKKDAAQKVVDDMESEKRKARESLNEAKKLSKKSTLTIDKKIQKIKDSQTKLEWNYENWLHDQSAKLYKKLETELKKYVSAEECSDPQNAIELYMQQSNQEIHQLVQEKTSIKQATSAIAERQKSFDKAEEKRKEAKAAFQECSKAYAKTEKARNEAEKLKSEKLSIEELHTVIDRRLAKMLEIFGSDFFVEIQYHGIAWEEEIYPYLVDLARKNQIPLVAANDVHMAANTAECRKARQIRRSCRYKKWEEENVGDKELYIKDDEELLAALSKLYPEDVVLEAMNNVEIIVNACNVEPVKESHYPKAKVENVSKAIEDLARNAIPKKYGTDWDDKKEQRLQYELGIIDQMGYSDYFYITYDILNVARQIGALSYEGLAWMKQHGAELTLGKFLSVLKKKGTHRNLSVGLGRGSGAGSMVCYLLGITNIDPMRYNLLFERFLNPERISMPDIDSDFRTDIKDVLLIYLQKVYGERAIAQILTKSFLHGKSAIDKTVTILEQRDGCSYKYYGSKLKRKDGVSFKNNNGKDSPLKESEQYLLADCESDIEKEIAETAIIMDQNLDHTGLHAAGVIISDNNDLADYIPVAWDSNSSTWKTQCDMVQAEGHGLLKMDLLLLKTLDIVTYTLRLIEKSHPDVDIDIENLPFEKEVFEKIFGRGDTKCVFQFESAGMQKFLKQMHPSGIEDIIAANAMYRPGPMDFIPTYLVNHEHPDKIQYDCPEMEPILSETYGCIIYQEQVMRIVRDLAGFSLGRSDLVRRAMSKKHEDELLRERKNFIYGNEAEGIKGCVDNGISEEVASKIFDRMIDFAKYAFNKSHATVYAVLAYMMAWLKLYYPLEFFCGNLNFIEAQKELPSILSDAQKHGIAILPPDVNKSEYNFALEDGSIRFGLGFLRGTKSKAQNIVNARNGCPFVDLKDLIKRCDLDSALAKACIYSGACDELSVQKSSGRNSLWQAYQDLSDLKKKIVANEKKLEKENKVPGFISNTLKEHYISWNDYLIKS